HETTTAVEASLPNCRCRPPTGCAPLCFGWVHRVGPWPGDPRRATPEAPSPAPTRVGAAVGVRPARGPQYRMPVAAASGDDVRISDRDVVQVVADDRVDEAVQFPAECG